MSKGSVYKIIFHYQLNRVLIMEDLISIMVTRPVYNQFQTILIEAQFTSDGLMKHFFHLYYRSLNQKSREDRTDNQIILKQSGEIISVDWLSTFPKDISVNVTVPDLLNAETEYTDKINESHKGSAQQQTLVCNVCQFKTKGIKKFKNHIRKHTEKQISSPCQGETILDDSNLKFHIQSNHETTNENRNSNLINGDEEMHDTNKEHLPFQKENGSGDGSNHFNLETTLNMHRDNAVNCGMEENLKQMMLIKGDNRIKRLQDPESSESAFILQDDTEKGRVDIKQLYSKVKMKRKGFFCNLCFKTFPRFGIFWNIETCVSKGV
ncbi:unnamed protein product [Mytilus edulis]|uniref:C2H2-type domain-containing protein n=1 Tax=Mytilus edulis TaxID=6550 RepID=A0A8S3Q2B3_MYTED|nr:unnamed protein product [Mytilus edulis]